MDSSSRTMTPGRWVLVGCCALIVVLLAVFSQGGRPADPEAAVTPSGGESVQSAEATVDPSADAQQQELERFLVEDLPRRVAGDPMAAGAVDAPVVLTQWSDYRCPFCSVWAEETLPELQPLVDSGVLRIELRDMAIFGDESVKAATAARAAGVQGKYFEFAHELFVALPNEGHPDIPDELVLSIVSDLGLDVDQFQRDWADPVHSEAVRADSEEGAQLGISSTPAFIIGSQYLSGAQPTETFLMVIDQQAALLSR